MASAAGATSLCAARTSAYQPRSRRPRRASRRASWTLDKAFARAGRCDQEKTAVTTGGPPGRLPRADKETAPARSWPDLLELPDDRFPLFGLPFKYGRKRLGQHRVKRSSQHSLECRLTDRLALDSLVFPGRLAAVVRLLDHELEEPRVIADLRLGQRDPLPINRSPACLLEHPAGVGLNAIRGAANLLIADVSDGARVATEQRHNVGVEKAAALPVGRGDRSEIFAGDPFEYALRRASLTDDQRGRGATPAIEPSPLDGVLGVLENRRGKLPVGKIGG